MDSLREDGPALAVNSRDKIRFVFQKEQTSGNIDAPNDSNVVVQMAHFLRGKQAGVQKDFSAGLDPRLFAIDQVR